MQEDTRPITNALEKLAGLCEGTRSRKDRFSSTNVLRMTSLTPGGWSNIAVEFTCNAAWRAFRALGNREHDSEAACITQVSNNRRPESDIRKQGSYYQSAGV
jgi:hypothetical protein